MISAARLWPLLLLLLLLLLQRARLVFVSLVVWRAEAGERAGQAAHNGLNPGFEFEF